MMSAARGGGDYFGPQIDGYFDFTVLFDQSILSILPTALLILLAPVRIARLFHDDARVRSGKMLMLKLVNLFVTFPFGMVDGLFTGGYRGLRLPSNRSRGVVGSTIDA